MEPVTKWFCSWNLLRADLCSWNFLHNDFSPRETDFACGTCSLLIFWLLEPVACCFLFVDFSSRWFFVVIETCCILIFLLVKLVIFFSPWNWVCSLNLFCADFCQWNWLRADFCSWNLLHIDFSLRETCTMIFLLVKLILFKELAAC